MSPLRLRVSSHRRPVTRVSVVQLVRAQGHEASVGEVTPSLQVVHVICDLGPCGVILSRVPKVSPTVPSTFSLLSTRPLTTSSTFQ